MLLHPRLLGLILCLLALCSSSLHAQDSSIVASSEPVDSLAYWLAEGFSLLEKEPTQALQIGRKIQKEARRQGLTQREGEGLFLEGRAHLRLRRPVRGARALEKALPLIQSSGDTNELMGLYQSLAQAFFQRKDKEKAAYYGKAFRNMEETVLTQQREERLHALEETLEEAGGVEEEGMEGMLELENLRTQMEADSALELVNQHEETLLRQNLALTELQMKIAESEKAKMEAEKAAMEAENQRNLVEIRLRRDEISRQYWLGSSVILALLLSALFIYWYQKRQRKKELARERERTQRLQQIDELKDQFLANTSHELRTPLNGIIGLTEGLLDQIQEKQDEPAMLEELDTSLRMVAASGRRLASLVNDLLDFSRIRNADLSLNPRPIDVRSVADIVLRVSQPLIMGKEIQLENHIPANLPAAHADEDRLTQILHNLIGNGIKFTEKGFVKVGAEEQDGMLKIWVQDSGIGIRAEQQDKVFEAFEQGDGSTARAYSGTGLGLSITRQLVERHGGEVWLESEVGKGSTFFITLPVSTEKAEVRKVEDLSNRLTPLIDLGAAALLEVPDSQLDLAALGEEGIRILIVDDEPINHQVLKQHLRSPHFQVVSAMNGPEALDLILHAPVPFDLILLDVMMPGMSGYEVAQKIRKTFLPSELPIIMITAKNQVSDLVQGLNTGANDYLAKPFTKDEFLARLRTHLNLRQINHVTNRFVPTEFIRALGSDTIAELSLGDHSHQEVTVMFTDIRSYTSLSEQMTPEETFGFVQAYTRRMGPIVQRNQGFINQYLGDGLMAIFQKHPQHALQAAIDMQEELRAYNIGRKAKNRQPIAVGMGIHTGPLIMGIIGDTLRSSAAVIADSVNTASRLEGLTKHYGVRILVSDSSYQELLPSQQDQCRYLGLVQVKGRKAPLGIYECFAGDETTMAGRKYQTRDMFDQALQHYLLAKFDLAQEGFKEALKRYPEDTVAQHFLALAEEYAQLGIPQNWKGIELMDGK